MGGKAAIALGLVAGIAAGGLLVGGILALTPGPDAPAATVGPTPFATAMPSDAPSSAPASAPASAAPAASSSPAVPPTGSPPVSAEAWGAFAMQLHFRIDRNGIGG